MKYVAYIVPFVLIPLIVRGVLALLFKPKAGKTGYVRLNGALAVIGTVGMLALMIPALYLAFVEGQVLLPIVLTGFGLLCFSLVLGYINCRTTYDADGFVSSNFFGVKTAYRWEDITGIKRGQGESYLYMGAHRVMVDAMAIGGLEFLAYANARYAERHDGTFIPDHVRIKGKKGGFDPFNGHILNPGQFVALWVILFVLLGVLYGVMLGILLTPTDPADTQSMTVVFTSCERRFGTLILHDTEGREYRAVLSETYDAAFDALSTGGVAATVHVKQTVENGQTHYKIYAAERDGVSVLTFEERDADYLHSAVPVLIGLSIAMLVLWGAFVVLSVVFGRNPKKYPRAVRLFFKEDVIIY